MIPPRSQRRDRCRSCGQVLNAWLAVLKRPNGVPLLGHLGLLHRDKIGAYLDRMHHDDEIGPVAAEAFEVIEGDADEGS